MSLSLSPGIEQRIQPEGVPNIKTLAAMEEGQHGRFTTFTSVEDLMADLHANL